VGVALLMGAFPGTGAPVRMDPARGLALLKPACARGAGRACGVIGEYQRYERDDPREAEKWFKRACELGAKASCPSTPGGRAEAQAKLREDVRGSVNTLRVLGTRTGADGGATPPSP